VANRLDRPELGGFEVKIPAVHSLVRPTTGGLEVVWLGVLTEQ